MKLKIGLATLAGVGLVSLGVLAQNTSTLKDQDDKISYSIGLNVGSSLKRQTQSQGLNIKPEVLAAGVKDALSDSKPLLTEQEVHEVLSSLQRGLAEKQSEVGDKNKKAGDAFLAANKAKPGVKTLPSGLQYQVLTEGKGPKPKATDSVKANYKGTLIDGTVFDSSEQHGGPATFPLNGVIKGWTEALQLMPVGSKWRLFIPADLAYGESGAGNLIGPNSTLVFEVELLGIENAPKS
jgi:FKBP-type peptidyl-prolyl cis-trans isomerase FklB